MKNHLSRFLEWIDRGAHEQAGVRYYSQEDIKDLNIRIENYIHKCRLESKERTEENTFWRLIRMIDLLRNHPDYRDYCQRVGYEVYVPNTDYGFEVPTRFQTLSKLTQEITEYARKLLIRDDLTINLTHHSLLKNYQCFVKVLKQDIYSPHSFGLFIDTSHSRAILEFRRVVMD